MIPPTTQRLSVDQRQGFRLIQETIALSAHILQQDPSQLACQLTGRLGHDSNELVQRLLAGVERKLDTWLRPLTSTLERVSGANYRTFTGHTAAVNALAITPDSRRVISASGDGTVRVWTIANGTEAAILRVNRGLPQAVAVTPDGRWVVAGCSDGSITVWEWQSGRIVAVLEGHSQGVNAIRCTPDGRFAVSASADSTLRLWDLDSFSLLFVLRGHTAAVHGVAITPDGSKAVSASSDRTIRIWSLEDGRELTKMVSSWSQYAVAIAPDGRTAVSGSEMVPIRWDLEAAAEDAILTDYYGPLHGSDVTGVAITPDGRRVISASGDRTLKVWDLTDKYPLRNASLPTWATHQAGVTDVAITPDGRWAVSASSDKTVKVWNLVHPESQADPVQSTAHANPVKWVGFGPNREVIQLAVGYKADDFGEEPEWASSLWVGDTHFDWSYRARDVAQSSDRHTLLVAVGNGIEVIDVNHRTNPGGELFGAWAKIALSPDGYFALCYNWRTSVLQAWDRASGRSFILEEDTRAVETIAITSDGHWGVVGTTDGALKIWRLPDFSQVRALKGHDNRVTALIPDPAGRMISCGQDGWVRVWDLARGQADHAFQLSWMKSHSLQISGDGHRIAAVSESGAVMTWDLRTGRELACLPDGSVKLRGVWNTDLTGRALTNLALLNQRAWAVVCDGETVTLWDLTRGLRLASFTGDGEFETCALSPDDSILVVGTTSGVTHRLAIVG